MGKQSRKSNTSVTEITQLFQTAPEQAYDLLISSNHYFHTNETKSFWDAFMQLDHEKLTKTFPASGETFNKVVGLKLFYDLNEFYKTEKVKNIEALTALNPDETSLTKSLFLCLELGETSSPSFNFPNYSEESLKAIKILLRKVLPLLKEKNRASYSPELVHLSNKLIKIQTDIILLEEFLDAFVWAGFEITKKENSKGFALSLPDRKSKIENLFVLNHLKTLIKRDFKRLESLPNISREEHFKKNDPKWKTDKGLATVIHFGGITVTDQTPGTTFLQAEDDSLFNDIISEDPKKQIEANQKFVMLIQEQHFHFKLRHALSEIYQPNDEIDIHNLHLEIKSNIFVSLYDLICAMSCLIAKSDVFRYLSDFSNRSIKAVKLELQRNLKLKHPDLTDEKLHSIVDLFFVQSLSEIEKQKDINLFIFVDHKTIFTWLMKIEELKAKSEAELNAMIDLLTSLDSELPFNVLYKIDSNYYFSYLTCGRSNPNQLLYDNYLSDRLFNPHKKLKTEKFMIGKIQNSREISFTNSLKELFKTLTPHVEAGLKYGDPKVNSDVGDLIGDFDMIAYFEKENIIFTIQVKLSNVSPRSEKRKEEWIRNRIIEKGVQQVTKDLKFLQTEPGLRFVEYNLKTKNKIKEPLIYPLIVTDNFFADHRSFPISKNDSVICISYFELKHLILHQKVHDKQVDLLPFESNRAATLLFEAIKTNYFWNFLNDIAVNLSFSKTLSAINEDLKIEMRV